MQAQARLTLDEGISVAPYSSARVVGSARYMNWYPTMGALVAIFLGGLLSGLLPVAVVLFGWRSAAQWLPMAVLFAQLLLIALLMAVGWNRALARHQRAFLAGLRSRGAPDEADFTYHVSDEGFVVESPRVRHVLAWSGVLEVMPAPKHWLVLQDTMTYNIPKRSFAGPEAEQAFLAALLERISPEARDRSPEAMEASLSPPDA